MSAFDPLRTLASSVMLGRMRVLTIVSCWIVSVSLLSSAATADVVGPRNNVIQRICPTDTTLANLVAKSDLIVVATPDVPVRLVQSAMRKESPEYIDVPLSGASILKGGDIGSSLTLKVYPKKTTYAPSPKALVQQTRKPTLLFLTRVDQGPVGIYLTHSLDAVQDASATRVEAVRVELRRQEALSGPPTAEVSLPHYNYVRDLLSVLPQATPERQEEIFRKLEAFGVEGVPAIVAQMDDRRPLVVRRIALANHDPDAFEGLRHYGPELVVDALDAILNQITGFGGFVVNGGSERERQAAVAAWRVYAADLRCH